MAEGQSQADQSWEQTAEIVAMVLNTSPHRTPRSRWWKGRDLLGKTEATKVVKVSMSEVRQLLGL